MADTSDSLISGNGTRTRDATVDSVLLVQKKLVSLYERSAAASARGGAAKPPAV